MPDQTIPPEPSKAIQTATTVLTARIRAPGCLFPPNAAIEGETGLTCDNLSNDCHLLVVQGNTLFEAYRVTASGNDRLEAQCLAIWNLETIYPPEGRGEHCTSADAAWFSHGATDFQRR